MNDMTKMPSLGVGGLRILLVEDEPLAARRLTALLREVAPEATVVGQTESVRETVRWLAENPTPDLATRHLHHGLRRIRPAGLQSQQRGLPAETD
mgnify:CR=1 FL=1